MTTSTITLGNDDERDVVVDDNYDADENDDGDDVTSDLYTHHFITDRPSAPLKQ